MYQPNFNKSPKYECWTLWMVELWMGCIFLCAYLRSKFLRCPCTTFIMRKSSLLRESECSLNTCWWTNCSFSHLFLLLWGLSTYAERCTPGRTTFRCESNPLSMRPEQEHQELCQNVITHIHVHMKTEHSKISRITSNYGLGIMVSRQPQGIQSHQRPRPIWAF